MVPRQLVMRMSSGSSKPYEQAPAVEMHRQGSCPLQRTAVRAVEVVWVVELACTHALLALLELGEELKVAWDLSSHDSCLCGKTRKGARRKALRGAGCCGERLGRGCVYL